MQKRSIFQNRANECFYGQNNPLFPTHPPPKEKTILPGNSWFAFLSTVSIWDTDSVRFSFPDCFSVREAVEKKTGGNMRREMHSRFARVRCFAVFAYYRNLWNFLYNCDGIDAWLKHGFHRRMPCDHQTELTTFSRPLTLRWQIYEISRGQGKKIRLFDWLGSQLLERDTNFTSSGGRCSPSVISAPIDLDGRPNYFTRSIW